MPFHDLEQFIATTIQQKLEAALAPLHRSLARLEGTHAALQGMHAALGAALGDPPPAAARVASVLRVTSGAGPRGPRKMKTRAQRGDATRFKVGDSVRFHVGRGTLDGRVARLQVETGSVLIRRPGVSGLYKRAANAVTPVAGTTSGQAAKAAGATAGRLRALSATTGSRSAGAKAALRKSSKVKLRGATQRGDASKFKAGDKVRFKLGHNRFAHGVVTEADAKSHTLSIRRDGTATVVKRPPATVQAA